MLMNIRKANIKDVDSNLVNIFIDGFKIHLNGRLDVFNNDKTNQELKKELISIIQNDNNIKITICIVVLFRICGLKELSIF